MIKNKWNINVGKTMLEEGLYTSSIFSFNEESFIHSIISITVQIWLWINKYEGYHNENYFFIFSLVSNVVSIFYISVSDFHIFLLFFCQRTSKIKLELEMNLDENAGSSDSRFWSDWLSACFFQGTWLCIHPYRQCVNFTFYLYVCVWCH